MLSGKMYLKLLQNNTVHKALALYTANLIPRTIYDSLRIASSDPLNAEPEVRHENSYV